MASNTQEYDAQEFAKDKSEEVHKDWEKYWKTPVLDDNRVLRDTVTDGIPNQENGNGVVTTAGKNDQLAEDQNGERRWVFGMRHGERVDLTYGQWVPFCFDKDGKYIRRDLNLPIKLPDRVGGKDAYAIDGPLTRVGVFQAQLVGEGMRLAGIDVKHVYASAALRCVATAHAFLEGLQADPSVKIRVEPGLFEYKMWHASRGLVPFMTPMELYKAGYNVDLEYKPYVDLDVESPETLEEYFARNEKTMVNAVKDTEKEGGNIVFVGHAATLDMTAVTFKRLTASAERTEHPPYEVFKHLNRIPYCSIVAVRTNPYELVPPPLPPSINSASARFDWKMLIDVWNKL